MIPDFACLRCGHAWAAGRRCQNCRCAIRPRHCPACLSREWWLELGREVDIQEEELRYLRRVQVRAWRRKQRVLARVVENGSNGEVNAALPLYSTISGKAMLAARPKDYGFGIYRRNHKELPFVARAYKRGKVHHLGVFATVDEARDVRLAFLGGGK